MIYGNMVGGASLAQTYILQDSDGNEIPAVLVESETVFDATHNDIRIGKVAATETGVTTGTKEIPSYQTAEGVLLIPSGSEFELTGFKRFDFTKLQVIICPFNTTVDDSVATDKVSINGKVYSSNSTEALSEVTTDADSMSIKLNIVNDSDYQYVMRYFTYKEEY